MKSIVGRRVLRARVTFRRKPEVKHVRSVHQYEISHRPNWWCKRGRLENPCGEACILDGRGVNHRLLNRPGK